MFQVHQQITDETGNIFVLLPLEEYRAIFNNQPPETQELSLEEHSAISEGLADLAFGELISAQDVARQLGLSLGAVASKP
jgi:hypothetical protein